MWASDVMNTQLPDTIEKKIIISQSRYLYFTVFRNRLYMIHTKFIFINILNKYDSIFMIHTIHMKFILFHTKNLNDNQMN